jgi:cytochrome c2
LSVAAAGAVATNPAVEETASASLLVDSVVPLSLAIFGLGLLGAVVGIRRRSRPVLVLTSVCLLAGIALLVVGSGPASGAEAQAKSEFAGNASISQVEYGRQLFLAKGCITCHANSKATGSGQYMTIEMGAPNLSKFSANPEIIFMRLKDPASVKSDTKMPQLGLKEEEIEALVAFINSK